jgi:myo-inositol 2-dehydrogenase/D-chiro-inositol 1-dehydrogenase
VHRNKDVPDWFTSEMVVRDSLAHEVDVCRWLFGEEVAEITGVRADGGRPGG